jgi:hypothetical protein
MLTEDDAVEAEVPERAIVGLLSSNAAVVFKVTDATGVKGDGVGDVPQSSVPVV